MDEHVKTFMVQADITDRELDLLIWLIEQAQDKVALDDPAIGLADPDTGAQLFDQDELDSCWYKLTGAVARLENKLQQNQRDSLNEHFSMMLEGCE